MKVIALIPAYNEVATIRPLAEAVLALGLNLIIVDDGSTDNTKKQIENLSLTLIQHQSNKGKAASLKTGMDTALTQGADGILTLDGDGQHNPNEISKLLDAFAVNPNKLIIGARLLGREKAPKARRRANDFADFWISWAASKRIQDSQSGFRIYPAQAVKNIHINYNKKHGFVFESEFLIEAAHNGLDFVFVPIASNYPKQARASHFKPVEDITRIVLMVAGKLIRSGFNLRGLVRILLNRV